MNGPRLVFLDTETTGLHVYRGHVPWEVAIISAAHDTDRGELHVDGLVHLDIELTEEELRAADPVAMGVGGYHRRRDADGALSRRGGIQHELLGSGEFVEWVGKGDAAKLICRALRGAVPVGANPAFDIGMLEPLLWDHGLHVTSHHRLVDVRDLMAGCLSEVLGGRGATDLAVPPYDPKKLYAEFGVEIDGDDVHTALGDARLAMRAYAAVHELPIMVADGVGVAP